MKIIFEIVRLILCAIDFVIMTVAIIFLLGEEAPDANFSLWELLGRKILAGFALYLLYRGFLWKGKHNLLPFILIDDYKDIINPDSDANRV